MRMKKILLPVDDSEHSRRAADYAAGLAALVDAEVGVIHCYLEIPVWKHGTIERHSEAELKAKAEKTLALYMERLAQAGVRHTGQILHGPAGEIIAAQAASGGFDCIVMGSSGPVDFEGLLLRSVTLRVLHTATCPVLIVP